ncbi:MAG: NAD-dependent epimerase/dehydratase family protein [Ferruginibacter sp.]
MKVALTGAAGHLGAALLQELCKKDIPVKALLRDNDNRSCAGLPVEIVKGDLLHPAVLASLMQDCDTVIHCAALISVNGDHNGLVQLTNVEGTRTVIENALHAGIKRCIHISSIHTFQQKPSHEILDESRAAIDEKGFAYERSKLAGQQIALLANKKGMEVLLIHPTSIVGPYDHKPSLVGKVLIDMYTGKLPFIFNGGFDFCDCRDVAHAIVNSITMGRPGEAYLLGGKWHSLKKLAGILSKVSGKKISILAMPAFAANAGLPIVKLLAYLQKKEPLYTEEALDALFNGNRFISSVKAMNELNYTIRPFEETVSDTFNWFQHKNYL